MGLYDRDYTQDSFRSSFRGTPPIRMFFPKPSTMVMRLLIINVVIFVISAIIRPLENLFLMWFSVFPRSIGTSLQLWRLITYQFLHADLGHIFVNMLALFFFGPMLERIWGGRRFLTFYLICGAVGGLLYPLLALPGWLRVGPLVGASGAIFGILAAGAVLFPRQRVYVWGIFPIPLMFLAFILALISILNLFGGYNTGGEVAHLSGAAAGVVYVFWPAWRTKFKLKRHSGRWEKKIARHRNLQFEVDRILQKVHDYGIHRLTSKEKKILKDATKAEQMRNRL